MSDLLGRDPEDINYNLPEETELPPEAEIDELETLEVDKPEFTENNLDTLVDRIIWEK